MRARTIVCLVALTAAVPFAARAQSASAMSDATSANVQTDKVTMATGKDGKPMPSPRHELQLVQNTGGTRTKIDITYGAPSVRGRKIFGDVVPYGNWWRAGANEATSFVTDRSVRIGDLMVPAGSYTLDVLPGENGWQLIVNKATGQWGTQYDESKDLGRVAMKVTDLAPAQETLSYSFSDIKANGAVLHIRWADKDAAVPVEFVGG